MDFLEINGNENCFRFVKACAYMDCTPLQRRLTLSY